MTTVHNAKTQHRMAMVALCATGSGLRFGVWEACRTTGGPGGWPPGLVAPQAKFFGGPTYKYIQMVCRTACRTANARPHRSRHGPPDHLPDRLKFAGPFAGPGVVWWSVKPNRSPAYNSSQTCSRELGNV